MEESDPQENNNVDGDVDKDFSVEIVHPHSVATERNSSSLLSCGSTTSLVTKDEQQQIKKVSTLILGNLTPSFSIPCDLMYIRLPI